MKYDFDEVINRKNTQSSKWDNVGTRVGNPDALPMWVADSDFRCPQPIVDAIKKRAEHEIYGYTYILPEFRDATIHWVLKRHGWHLKPEWIVFCTGVVPVLNTMIQAFTGPGDEVIIQRPVYHPFIHAIIDNNRVVSSNSLLCYKGKYSIDFSDLEKRAQSKKAKLMFLCNPHNPVGRVFTKEELVRIEEICLQNNIILISDEIHSDLIYEGHKHVSVASLNERYLSNTVTCFAPSKTFNVAGLRASGIVVPNPEIRRGLEKQFVRNRSVQQNIFGLPGYIAAYNECEDYLEQLICYLQCNVDFLDSFLKKNMPKIKLVYPEATYLMWMDCSELGLCSDELADFFINKSLVAINRGDMFGPEGASFARLNIACPRLTLKQALNQIQQQYKELKGEKG